MYCTPKIHKEDVPLRPIVDYTGTIAYNLSRSLADLLQPLVGNTDHFVKNSKHLVESLKDEVIGEGEMFVSYDVVSLFTNTPVSEAMEIIRGRLEQDATLKDRTFLDASDIVDLLRFVLTTTYFKFRGQIYQQKFGAAMGSPPIVANLFMEHLEQEAIESAPAECKPRIWKRYVDDILAVIPSGQADTLKEHLNQVDGSESIKFTVEEEVDSSIAFLDTRLTRNVDGTIKFTVFRKKTHTDQYLNFSSHHPLHQKMGVVRTLLDRSEGLVTNQSDKECEEDHIMEALGKCGYPKWTIQKVKHQRQYPKEKEERERKGMVVVPYVKGISEAVSRIFRKHQIDTAMRPMNTLRERLVHPKDKMDKGETGDVVYQISCKNCDNKYIGETSRLFKTRLGEHRREAEAVSKERKYTRSEKVTAGKIYNKSAITDHVMRDNHVIDWEGAGVLDHERDTRARRVREAIWIRRSQPAVLNRDQGAYQLPQVYNSIIAAPPSGDARASLHQRH